MEVYEKCFNVNLDPDRCERFKIRSDEIGDRCKICPEFIFINWESMNLPREKMRELYWRLKKLTNPQELETGLYYAKARNDIKYIKLIEGLINETIYNNTE